MDTEQTQVVGVADEDRTQVASPFGVEATQQAIRIECPVCRTSNPTGERWCQDCGFLLSGAPGEAPPEQPPTESMARLIAGGDEGRELVLHAGANTVGRESADVLLHDASVSRRHATITLEDAAAQVMDHGSTNGTRVAGEVLPPNEPRALYDGDEIRFGSAVFKIALPDGSPRPAEEAVTAEPVVIGDRPIRARLMAADGSDLALREGVNTLGRRSENDLVVRGDPYVSGRHAEIHCGDEGCVLVDGGSTNGTFLRSQRLAPGDRHDLASGDEVRLGQSVFIFETVTPAEPAVGLEDAGAAPEESVEAPETGSTPVETPAPGAER